MSIIFAKQNISIEDDGNRIKFICPKPFSLQCKPFLANIIIVESSDFDTYFIDKTNEASINIISQIINQDIKTLYKPITMPTILPNPFTSAPIPNVGPQMLGNPIINNIGQLSAHLTAKNQNNNLFSSNQNFPNIVYTKKGLSEETFAVADYNANTVVLFTTQEFSNKYKYIWESLSPIYNNKLKTSSTSDDRSPGWVFKKSDPNVAIMINNLTGEDTFSKISKQPNYENKKFGNSFLTNSNNTGPVLLNNTLPPLVHQTTKPVESIDPIHSFQFLIEQLSENLTEVKEKKLTHPLGEISHGFIGPVLLTDEKVKQYLEQYENFEAKIDAEFVIGNNKVVLISRKLTN